MLHMKTQQDIQTWAEEPGVWAAVPLAPTMSWGKGILRPNAEGKLAFFRVMKVFFWKIGSAPFPDNSAYTTGTFHKYNCV